MIDEVVKDIYRIEIPLPIPVVGSINCYVIKDSKRSLVIDPGMAHDMCHSALMKSLDEIGVVLQTADFLITHHHLDHFGLLSRIVTERSIIYASRIETRIIENIASKAILSVLSRLLDLMGFPEDDPCKVLSELIGDEYRGVNQRRFRHLADSSKISRGGRDFRCYLSPGHSPGHICLYVADEQLLISGDMFSPVIQFFSDKENPLRRQLKSMRNLSLLNVRSVLPGHRAVFTSVNQTREQLETHHKFRNESILHVLADRSMDAYQIAERLAPGTKGSERWSDQPNILKFIACRDCLAHVVYLESEGRITKQLVAGRMVYSLTKNGK